MQGLYTSGNVCFLSLWASWVPGVHKLSTSASASWRELGNICHSLAVVLWPCSRHFWSTREQVECCKKWGDDSWVHFRVGRGCWQPFRAWELKGYIPHRGCQKMGFTYLLHLRTFKAAFPKKSMSYMHSPAPLLQLLPFARLYLVD